MKKLLASIAAVLMLGLPASAGDLDTVKLSLTAVTTNTTNANYDSDSTTTRKSGVIEAIYFDIAASTTCTVSIVTDTNNAAMPSQTILTVTALAADGWYYPQHPVVNAANSAIAASYRPFSFLGTKLMMRAGSSSDANTNLNACNISAFIVFENK